jgi:hypothetical protein
VHGERWRPRGPGVGIAACLCVGGRLGAMMIEPVARAVCVRPSAAYFSARALCAPERAVGGTRQGEREGVRVVEGVEGVRGDGGEGVEGLLGRHVPLHRRDQKEMVLKDRRWCTFRIMKAPARNADIVRS